MSLPTPLEFLEGLGPHLIYLGMFGVLLLSALGLPLPEDLTLIAIGFLIHRRLVHPLPAVTAGILGILVGDQFVYSLGRHFGPRIVGHRWFAHFLSPARFEWIRERFHRLGAKLVFLARFMSGLRGPVFIAAGILQMPRGRFLLYDFAGAVISVPLFILLGWLAGPHLESLVRHLGRAKIGFLALLGLVAAFFAIRLLARKRVGMAEEGPEGK